MYSVHFDSVVVLFFFERALVAIVIKKFLFLFAFSVLFQWNDFDLSVQPFYAMVFHSLSISYMMKLFLFANAEFGDVTFDKHCLWKPNVWLEANKKNVEKDTDSAISWF